MGCVRLLALCYSVHDLRWYFGGWLSEALSPQSHHEVSWFGEFGVTVTVSVTVGFNSILLVGGALGQGAHDCVHPV